MMRISHAPHMQMEYILRRVCQILSCAKQQPFNNGIRPLLGAISSGNIDGLLCAQSQNKSLFIESILAKPNGCFS